MEVVALVFRDLKRDDGIEVVQGDLAQFHRHGFTKVAESVAPDRRTIQVVAGVRTKPGVGRPVVHPSMQTSPLSLVVFVPSA